MPSSYISTLFVNQSPNLNYLDTPPELYGSLVGLNETRPSRFRSNNILVNLVNLVNLVILVTQVILVNLVILMNLESGENY